LVDTPQAPSAPSLIYSQTSETQIAVQWDHVESTQLPGARVFGFVLEMLNVSTTYGEYIIVFDGSKGFPDVKSFLITDRMLIVPGQSYLFRVKAAYQNGLTMYSEQSSPLYSCSSPGLLLPPKQVTVSSSQITL